jgi:hypothetical protein
MNANDIIVITHKADPTHPDQNMRDFVKPDHETTYANYKNYEAVNSKIIKEMYPKGSPPVRPTFKPVVRKEFVEKVVEKLVEKPFTNANLIRHFLAMGKTPLSISKYLGVSLAEVEKHELQVA